MKSLLFFLILSNRVHLRDQLIHSKNRIIKVNSRCNDDFMNLQITFGKTIYTSFINNVDCPYIFSFDEHPSTSKFLLIVRAPYIFSCYSSVIQLTFVIPFLVPKFLNDPSSVVRSSLQLVGCNLVGCRLKVLLLWY